MYWPTSNATFATRHYQITTELEEFMGDIVKRTFAIRNTKRNVS